MKIIQLGSIIFAAISLWCFTASAQSQKPVRIIAGAAAGGGVDFLARIVAQSLSEQLKQNFVVENHSGAGGTLAANQVAKAAPDGYTLLACTNAEITLSPHVMANITYDPLQELTPVVLLASAPTVVIVHPSVPAKNMGDLIKYARSKGSIGYGTPGYGSNAHINFELVRRQRDLPVFHVPYKGGGPAVLDLLSGQLELALLNTPPTISAIRSGNLRDLRNASYSIEIFAL
jgi:tripartite-type tricarboxylate transporter receptor subunit TctC